MGFLVSETVASQAERIGALRDGLRERGYAEGRNLAIETRAADGRYERLPDLAAQLVAARVDVIVAFGIKALEAAHGATSTLPIVIPATSSDLVALGLVQTLARPGGNVTGSTTFGPEIMVERVEIVREIAPATARIAVLVNPANAAAGLMLKQMDVAAHRLQVRLESFAVRAPGEFADALGRMAKSRMQAIVLQDDTLFGGSDAAAIAQGAIRQRLLSVGGIGFADVGGAVGLGRNDADLYRRGAHFVDRILRGEKPAVIPVEQATRFELVLNLATVRALAIRVPDSVRLRANRTIP